MRQLMFFKNQKLLKKCRSSRRLSILQELVGNTTTTTYKERINSKTKFFKRD